MTSELQTLFDRYQATQRELFLKLAEILELAGQIAQAPAMEARPPATPRTPVRQPTAVRTPQMPHALTPAPKPGVVLTDAVRAKHLPDATAIALKVLKVIGDNSQLVPGVTGQLALERIPYDPTLVQQAIEAAKGQL